MVRNGPESTNGPRRDLTVYEDIPAGLGGIIKQGDIMSKVIEVINCATCQFYDAKRDECWKQGGKKLNDITKIDETCPLPDYIK